MDWAFGLNAAFCVQFLTHWLSLARERHLARGGFGNTTEIVNGPHRHTGQRERGARSQISGDLNEVFGRARVGVKRYAAAASREQAELVSRLPLHVCSFQAGMHGPALRLCGDVNVKVEGSGRASPRRRWHMERARDEVASPAVANSLIVSLRFAGAGFRKILQRSELFRLPAS